MSEAARAEAAAAAGAARQAAMLNAMPVVFVLI